MVFCWPVALAAAIRCASAAAWTAGSVEVGAGVTFGIFGLENIAAMVHPNRGGGFESGVRGSEVG